MKASKILKSLDSHIKTKSLNGIKENLISLQNLSKLKSSEESLIETRKEIIRVILLNDIKFSAINNKKIETIKIEISFLLGENFHDKIREIIIKNKASFLLDKYKSTIKDSITSLESVSLAIKSLYTFIEEEINYSFVYPREWNLKSIVIFNICVYLKQKIADFLFLKHESIKSSSSNKKPNNKIKQVIEEVVEFESTIIQEYFLNQCCNQHLRISKEKQAVFFDQDDVIIVNKNFETDRNAIVKYCKHKKMFSEMFREYLLEYVEILLGFELDIDFEKKQMGVYDFVIDFFKKTGEVLFKIRYFEEKKLFKFFINKCEGKLTSLMKKFKLQKSITKIIETLYNVEFLKVTYQDLIKSLIINYSLTENKLESPKFNEELLKFNTEQTHIFQKRVKKYWLGKTLKKNFHESIMDKYEKVFKNEETTDLYFKVKQNIIESLVLVLFAKISKIKFSKNLAGDLFEKVNELSVFFKNNNLVIPLINDLVEYLSIFNTTIEEPKIFVENYIKHGGKFDFYEILTRLNTKSYNLLLIEEYNNFLNTKTIQ